MATNEEFLSTIKEGCIQGWREHAVLASISGAQAILESNWGKSTLALKANNLFGIKGDYNGASLTVETKEFINKVFKIVEATFRKYPSWSESITDHSAFFTSTEWRKNNYAAVVGEMDYKKAAQALSDAGYATDPDYPAKLIKLIETYDLHQWDLQEEEKSMPSITINHTTINFTNQRITPIFIVWHDTGVLDQSDEGNAKYFKSVMRGASANYFIDENSITEVVEPGFIAWHVGDGYGKYGITNSNSIGIELCAEADGNFHPQTIANAIWLGKKLMNDWGIPVENNVRHYDASRKNCPQIMNKDGQWTDWYAFKAKLGGASEAAIAGPVRVPANYNAKVISGGYSLDSKPWGEDGRENWGSTDSIIGNEIYVFEESFSGEYVNAHQVGWIDKRAIQKIEVALPVTPIRIPVSYNATITQGGYSIDSHPWGEPGFTNWGHSDDLLGKTFYFYEENASEEYANALGLGWIDKRAIEKEKQVVASIIHLPNGKVWTIYPAEGPYTAGSVISLDGLNGECAFTILGERNEGKVLVVDIPNFGVVGLYYDADKGASITKVLG